MHLPRLVVCERARNATVACMLLSAQSRPLAIVQCTHTCRWSQGKAYAQSDRITKSALLSYDSNRFHNICQMDTCCKLTFISISSPVRLSVQRRALRRLVDQDNHALWAMKVADRLPLGMLPSAKGGAHEMLRYSLTVFFPI